MSTRYPKATLPVWRPVRFWRLGVARHCLPRRKLACGWGLLSG